MALDTSLPSFAETLSAHGIELSALEEALSAYVDLSHELLLEQDPHGAPFDFLAVSDQHEVLKSFLQFLRIAA